MRKPTIALVGIAAVGALTLGTSLGANAAPEVTQAVISESGNQCTAHIETNDVPWSWEDEYRVAVMCSSLEPGTEFRGVAVYTLIDEYGPWTQVTGEWYYSPWEPTGSILFPKPTAEIEFRPAGS